MTAMIAGTVRPDTRAPASSRPRMARTLPRSASRSTRATVCRTSVGVAATAFEVLETRVVADERELDRADRAVALLRDDDFGLAGVVILGPLVAVLAVDEHHDVGVLLE